MLFAAPPAVVVASVGVADVSEALIDAADVGARDAEELGVTDAVAGGVAADGPGVTGVAVRQPWHPVSATERTSPSSSARVVRLRGIGLLSGGRRVGGQVLGILLEPGEVMERPRGT